MNFDNVGIDVGFGHTKWAVRLEDEIVTGSIPSLAPTASAKTVSTDVPHFTKRKTIHITVDGNIFEVGKDVKLATSSTNTGRSLEDGFPLTKNYMALLMGALYDAGADHVKTLVLGLPVHTIQKYADHLKSIFSHPLQVADRIISVDKIIVVPQPVGSLATYATQNNVSMSEQHTRLIIDVGYVTTDWVVASGFAMADSRSGGRVGGVSHILKNIAEQISAKYANGKIERFERIDESLVTKQTFQYFRHQIGHQELQSMLLQASPVIEETIKEIKIRAGEVDDLSEIILTGGGATYYEPLVRQYFDLNRVEVLSNPSLTNAIGFLLVGEKMMRRANTYGH
ncbi:PRTRC system protein D [Undibacterium oligocarboniphilum]|uniref:PRTRC system protein D n=1 Tax=Undibacterium oligocarboniphilum TaxID=666702 RepID=A0A850QMU0_9BURK|nr:PRTRC system protein D [Undibacterium oligocarboniphilum]MBC3871469.1 PRTRC system protein D [Undibacterium oligocarboniphilum]NVO78955.1 PRTRC system protein D [Undibacterium oligocarboniphilum]